ncbi:diphosphomevalonate decarboxylase [Facklamia miroungae]|uniref:diphosphomevalonate decarboxylase n=1 Tax=Facklamia miroungae TaxID=120956 RepID=A0A1G7RGE8_9LACT|nr:diphosphomevalonate decarboxylase [Facklamia miroungae]NKZ29426.1 diphosphomevalonate decarboxylase [Facklamia miroungae]SDG09714.1 diphosphomevalonate decarboxylase [Facklamia miroungae]
MSKDYIATYQAHTNIALIKYWGKRNQDLMLPVTSSLSLTLEAFYSQTQVHFAKDYASDQFILNDQPQSKNEVQKISNFLDRFRQLKATDLKAKVTSYNHVPTAAGLASSASAFAALACACNGALELNLPQKELSIMARFGSGSASRSLFGGFVEWEKGQGDDSQSSFAHPFDEADWDIAMIALIVNQAAKPFSSRQAMQHTIESSPFYALWAEEVASDLKHIKRAIKARDIHQIGQIAEHNAMKMHATMLAANPSFTYFQAESLQAMEAVRQLRKAGLTAYFTMDAGPNVKIICPYSEVPAIQAHLSKAFDPQNIIVSRPGPQPFPIPTFKN